MKGIQGSGTSLVEGYPEKKHPFTKQCEKVPFLYNRIFKQAMKVIKIDVTTNKVLKIYNSIREAGRNINKDPKGIQKCLSGEQKTCGGYKWEYLK